MSMVIPEHWKETKPIKEATYEILQRKGMGMIKIKNYDPYSGLTRTEYDILLMYYGDFISEEAIRQYLIDENEGVEGGMTLDEIDEAMMIISR